MEAPQLALTQLAMGGPPLPAQKAVGAGKDEEAMAEETQDCW